MNKKTIIIMSIMTGVIIGLITALVVVLCLNKKDDNRKENNTTTTTTKLVEYTFHTEGYYVNKHSDYWAIFMVNSKGNIELFINPCPGEACGALGNTWGPYSRDKNTIKFTLVEYWEDFETYKVENPEEDSFEIISDTEIKYGEDIYTYTDNLE